MKIVKLYARGGFVTCLVFMDMEFEKFKDIVGLLEVNITAAREHVAEIERQIILIRREHSVQPLTCLTLISNTYISRL